MPLLLLLQLVVLSFNGLSSLLIQLLCFPDVHCVEEFNKRITGGARFVGAVSHRCRSMCI